MHLGPGAASRGAGPPGGRPAPGRPPRGPAAPPRRGRRGASEKECTRADYFSDNVRKDKRACEILRIVVSTLKLQTKHGACKTPHPSIRPFLPPSDTGLRERAEPDAISSSSSSSSSGSSSGSSSSSNNDSTTATTTTTNNNNCFGGRAIARAEPFEPPPAAAKPRSATRGNPQRGSIV